MLSMGQICCTLLYMLYVSSSVCSFISLQLNRDIPAEYHQHRCCASSIWSAMSMRLPNDMTQIVIPESVPLCLSGSSKPTPPPPPPTMYIQRGGVPQRPFSLHVSLRSSVALARFLFPSNRSLSAHSHRYSYFM